ncbi:DUF1289 domain-containing protein [Aestuariirhabdus litorea]|uniref:DUF1289 domain-containing protein n=1 Tax=Aestuariirhabdus litorea TaxID=2528527 RepID=A0A3P3VMP5_9GAMM|nr:DUF1289 domain-containing protein [Aestuariirhabdus litorea]RRJ82999.1 DUF1289 domain-containing protein [Aestuariirhabdus litorea]RWW93158.1 DUF1289 domain-containing protein [Endozoicomonadaceae bacterium GTF-13]
MKFSPCISECVKDEPVCSGCGRSREEINGSKALVQELVDFMERMEYDNPEEFLEVIRTKALKKYSALQAIKQSRSA